MPQLILHHFDASPFAEKVRLAMGLKGLAWRSVQIPMIIPKPDLMPLTGGYRKTPVLQIGADIYCDTSLIARELEARFPEPSLFPTGGQGLAFAFSHWSDKAFFEPGAGLSMGENKEIPEAVLTDRKAFFNFMDFDRMAEAMPHCYAQFQAHAQLIEDELSGGGTDYLAGEQPSWLDIQGYFSIWMAQGNIPRADELLEPFAATRSWAVRMERIGHGEPTEIAAADALAEAAVNQPAEHGVVTSNPFHSFQANDKVTVTPDDYGAVPVSGVLRALDQHRVSIERSEPELGTVAVHFPRIGYCIEAV